jgi:aquaporin Z
MIGAFKMNWKLYLMEALGLAIFMISACFFSALLESHQSQLNRAIPTGIHRLVIMGVMMGLSALFIFYFSFTSPSGAHINPAVTITFFRLGKIQKWDAMFYIIFQFIGGTLAVYLMAGLMDDMLTAPPVNYAVTVPRKNGTLIAVFTELAISFVMMSIILFTSAHDVLKKYTRIIAAIFVSLFVVIAGPVSGFGMNPARTFASALPSHTWSNFWIYLFIPVTGMLCAAEVNLLCKKVLLKKYRCSVSHSQSFIC